jgi:hypothetical protein
MRWMSNVAGIGMKRVANRVWWGNLRVRINLEVLDVDGRIILKWIFMKSDRVDWTYLVPDKYKW